MNVMTRTLFLSKNLIGILQNLFSCIENQYGFSSICVANGKVAIEVYINLTQSLK